MIGQNKIREYFNNLSDNRIPHFIVLIGSKGCGKTTLANEVAEKLSATFAVVGIKVDEIREVIDTAYHTRDKILYCIKDADNMRAEAKNAMLKITEEPPENAWFIMTVQDDSSLLATIKSRASVFKMQPYTPDELREYYKMNYTQADSDEDTIVNIATTPYEVDKLVEYGGDFLEFVELVVDNIAEVEPANAFKSSNKLCFKSDGDGYDVKLFLEVFIYLCLLRIYKGSDEGYYSKGIIATTPYLSTISRIGVNKQQVYDSWVFDIRSAWS